MTEQPLSSSPLQIERHEFLEIVVRASEQEDANPELALGFRRQWAAANEQPRRWRMVLTIIFGNEMGGKETTYSGALKIAGYFTVADQYPAEKISDLIKVTGASILYGACREMLANLTARGPHGMVSLPSVSFMNPTGNGESAETAASPTKTLPAGKSAKGEKTATREKTAKSIKQAKGQKRETARR